MKYVLLCTMFFYCCQNKKTNDQNLEFERVYSLKFKENNFNGELIVRYRHYIHVKNYSDMLFEKTKILSVTKNYMDSCTTNKVEIGSIYYMKAVENCGFESNELNYEEINSNSLLGFYFEKGAIIGIKVFNGSSDKLFKINGHKVTEE